MAAGAGTLLLETGAVSSKAELARAMGVSRAAVTMGLAKLEACRVIET